MTIFIITDSWDITTDIVIKKLHVLGGIPFRLNTDQIRDYKIQWTQQGFFIENPVGAILQSSEITSVYWRKPFTANMYNDSAHLESFFYEECRYLIREMYNFCKASGAYAFIEEGAERRLGKLRQLAIAKQFFEIPEWKIILGHDYTAPKESIVKSLSGNELNKDSVLYTTRVDGKILDARYAWLLQKAISRKTDATICFVKGYIFAFKLKNCTKVQDWRTQIGQMKSSDWQPMQVSQDFANNIQEFMNECRLDYGRLDFVLDENAKAYFLEVNPNGQWAWLDPDDSYGLVTAIAQALMQKEFA